MEFNQSGHTVFKCWIHTWFIDKIIIHLLRFSGFFTVSHISRAHHTYHFIRINSYAKLAMLPNVCILLPSNTTPLFLSALIASLRATTTNVEAAYWRICLLRFYCVFVEPLFFAQFRPMLIKSYPPYEFHEYIFSTWNSIRFDSNWIHTIPPLNRMEAEKKRSIYYFN